MHSGDCPHRLFFEDRDEAQGFYEKARHATLNKRYRIDNILRETLNTHGVAGLFLNPERILVRSSPSRISPRSNTALHHTHLSEELFETIARSLAEGVGISPTARIQQVNKKTVLMVLAKAGAHAAKVNRTFLVQANVSECQLDEMWSFVGKKEKNLEPIEKLHRVLGDAWIWIAFDAVNKVVLAHVVGKRTLPSAVSLLEEVKRVTTSMPKLFSSDQLDHYAHALLQVYGKLVQPRRKPGPGRHPHPRLVPPKDLLYVHVVKQYKQYKVVEVTRKVIFGDPARVDKILAASEVSRKINTSYVERNNGIVRHMDSRCVRKSLRFSKSMENHKLQLALTIAYYHFCKPHRTLTKRHGKSTTPFMAANLTDHVWSMSDLLRFTNF